MRKKSDQFEILISRIHKLLEDDNAAVKWNERIPDPDNPKRGRQVDVLIKKDGLINIIECRLHKEPQDVKWIEELMGRRISLEANSIVAVSNSGFTYGAIQKANKYGVILKDFNKLTNEEIISWSRSIEVSLFYYRYEDFKLAFLFSSEDIDKIEQNQIKKELQNYMGFNALFKAQLDLIDQQKLIIEENQSNNVPFRVKFIIEDFQICDAQVQEIEASGIAYLEEKKLIVPEILAYGSPEYETKDRDVYIQNYNLGESKVIQHNGHVSLTLDISKLETPPYWQFRFITVESKYENYMDLLEIVGPENINMKVDKIDLSIVSFAYK